MSHDADNVSTVGDVAIGDLNGDGLDDIVVAHAVPRLAYPGGPTIGFTDAKADVIFGVDVFESEFHVANIDGSNGFRIHPGEQSNDFFRDLFFEERRAQFSLASDFDINGDGIDDLLIGDAFAGTFSSWNDGLDMGFMHGEAYLVYGRSESEFTDAPERRLDIPVGSEVIYTVQGTLVNGALTGGIDLELQSNQVDAYMTELGYTFDSAPSDLDRNGAVGFSDFLILSMNFGLSEVQQEDGDIDGDGTVSFADFLLLRSEFV